MAKSPVPPSLDLSAAKTDSPNNSNLSPSTLSPESSRSPRSNTASPSLRDTFESGTGDATGDQVVQSNTEHDGSASPAITAVPQYPPSPPKTSPKHGRDHSKSFFQNLMASKSSHRLQPIEQDATDGQDKKRSDSRDRASSKERGLYSTKVRGSTPDLIKNSKLSDSRRERSVERKPVGSTGGRQPEAGSSVGGTNTKKAKGRFGLMARTKSIRSDDQHHPVARPAMRLDLHSPSTAPQRDPQFSEPIKTAPLRSEQRERAFGELAGSTQRNRSADRPPVRHDGSHEEHATKSNWAGSSLVGPGSFRESNLFSNLHHSGRGAADKLGKVGKDFLGRITRNSPSQEQQMPSDDNYACTTITLPLVKQTRRTRIARRLELSKDKTEFWMPALPWRCIDYLNMNGCEEEGLYRIPGSNRDVKHWQRRFDTEYDINLFDEPELYDINTIGSMFKAWLRDLPDEVLPKSVQNKIAEQCMGATKTPQLLKDELSKLPPFNYYLLFAITCHLSLLHSFADKNKMDFRNLSICFQPCLKMDGFCFQFLVQDWKNCWQGCWTEKEYLEEEYRIQAEGEDADSHVAVAESEERAVSSSGSSQHQPTTTHQPPPSQQQVKANLLRKGIHTAGNRRVAKATATTKGNGENALGGFATQSSNASMDDQRSTSTTATDDKRDRKMAMDSELPTLNPLSPIKL